MSEPPSTEPEPRESPADSDVADASVDVPRQITAPQHAIPAAAESEHEPEPEPDENPSFEQLETEARRQFEIFRDHAREPSPPPSSGKIIDEGVTEYRN